MGDRTESSYLFQQVAKPCVVDFREEIKRESGIHIEEYKRKRDCRLNLGLTGQMAHLSFIHQDSEGRQRIRKVFMPGLGHLGDRNFLGKQLEGHQQRIWEF